MLKISTSTVTVRKGGATHYRACRSWLSALALCPLAPFCFQTVSDLQREVWEGLTSLQGSLVLHLAVKILLVYCPGSGGVWKPLLNPFLTNTSLGDIHCWSVTKSSACSVEPLKIVNSIGSRWFLGTIRHLINADKHRMRCALQQNRL